MREPSPRSRGPLLWPDHSGLAAGTGRCAHRCVVRCRYGGRELTAETPRKRGDRGEPHRGVGGHRGGAVWPSDDETKRRRTELGDRAIRVRMEQAGARNGKVVWRRCSRVPFIGQGRRAGATEERSRRRPVEFNGAAVLSLESTPRGRGNGGAAPLRKGKWRRRSLGRGGGARRDGSRPDRRRRLGRLREGDEGGADRAGPEWPGGPNATWASAERKQKKEMGSKDVWAEMIFRLR
jgi:hypothetical protein